MRLQTNIGGIRFQLQELMVTLGVLSYALWNHPGLGSALLIMGVLGAICRSGFELAEKQKVSEAKQVESEKIKSATSALADAFSGLGSGPRSGDN
jgi:hypothetical protein